LNNEGGSDHRCVCSLVRRDEADAQNNAIAIKRAQTTGCDHRRHLWGQLMTGIFSRYFTLGMLLASKCKAAVFIAKYLILLAMLVIFLAR
jgi:hypothetical protein